MVSADLTSELSRVQVPGQHAIYRFGWLSDEALYLQSTPNHIQLFSVKDEHASYELVLLTYHSCIDLSYVFSFLA